MSFFRTVLILSTCAGTAGCAIARPSDGALDTDDDSIAVDGGSDAAREPGEGDSDASIAPMHDAGSEEEWPFEGEGTPWKGPAPRATCAAMDAPDESLQGLDGNVHCNLRKLSEVEAPHFLSMAWYGDCAYVNGNTGTTVIDVSDPARPVVTTTLTVTGFQSNWESMKASTASGLLAGYESNGSWLAVYDVAKNCTDPELKSSIQLGGFLGSVGHAGSFSPDGLLYYASSMYTATVFAVDLTHPEEPTVLSRDFERGAHDLFVGRQGTRGYFANSQLTSLTTGTLAIMDLTDVQARAPGAMGRLVKEISWEDGSVSQYPIAVTYRGKEHLIVTDEMGSGNCNNPEKPQWGYARILDISDEQAPSLVSLVKTEAQDPANCEAAGQAQGGTSGFGVGTHYCNVDRLDNPRLLSCGNWDGGVRLYDIRNPWRPREVAYFDSEGEGVPGLTRLYVEKRHLWVATTPGTFYVLEFPPGSPVDRILSGDE